jgi:threonine/homoserine efflux transporter RhtA
MLTVMNPPIANANVVTLQTPSYRHVALYVTVALAQLVDLLTFIPAVSKVGIGAESNPLARSLYHAVGAVGPAGLKVAAISIMIVALARVVRRFPRFVLPSAAVIVAIGLFGAGSNILFGLMR